MALPLVGNCYQKEALYLLRYLGKLRKRFGRMFTFFAFTKPYLVVCEPSVVRRILSDNRVFIKGVDYTSQFSVAFGQGLVTSNGEKHKHDRAIFGKYFVRNNLTNFMGTVNMLAADALVRSFPKSNNGNANNGKSTNIEEFFALLALRVFMFFSTGYDYRQDPEKEKEIAHQVSKGSWAVGRMITLGLPMWDIFPPVSFIRKARAAVWIELKKIVDGRKAMLARGEGLDIDDCLSAMLANNMSDEEMSDHMTTLVSAGHDTTAFFCAYMSYLLAQHQSCQDQLRDEMNNVLGGRTEVTPDDFSEMKYLQKIMQETLRLYTIIPCVSRYATDEIHIKEANVTIPKGANILIPMFLINRDPELWENPSEFNPNRFEGKGNEFTSAKNGFFPFGYGARTCIGNTLSQLEAAVFMCHLLRKFRLKPEPHFKPAIFAGISLTTSNGINVILEEL